jgi:hypothetical protein
MTIGNTFRAFTRTIFPGAKFDSEHWVDKKITIIYLCDFSWENALSWKKINWS